jgi:site-specific DNA-methyltransferase (adenine-specific)
MLEKNKIYNLDNLKGLRQLDDNSIDSIVTDPPYHLTQEKYKKIKPGAEHLDTPYGRARVGARGFMGKEWDGGDIAFSIELWQECLRVLKPGGHLLAFGGTRTYHRMACAIEDAGFEIRDQIMWVYGSGFPKSVNISKEIDRKKGVKGKVVGVDPVRAAKLVNQMGDYTTDVGWSAGNRTADIIEPSSDEAKEWDGWGTALKPAHEPIVVARKPLSEKTLAENVLKWGTGAINIEGSRIPASDTSIIINYGSIGYHGGASPKVIETGSNKGRWPANFILECTCDEVEVEGHSDPDCPCYILDKQSGISKSTGGKNSGGLGKNVYGKFSGTVIGESAGGLGDTGGASRFFYCSKASRKEKERGLEDLPEKLMGMSNGALIHGEESDKAQSLGYNRTNRVKNSHPTVKPLDLIKHLVKLVTPPQGLSLDIFNGSGTHSLACKELGFDFIGFELSDEYCEIASKRLSSIREEPGIIQQPELF